MSYTEGWTQALSQSQGLQKALSHRTSRFCWHSHRHATNTQVPKASRCCWTPCALPP